MLLRKKAVDSFRQVDSWTLGLRLCPNSPSITAVKLLTIKAVKLLTDCIRSNLTSHVLAMGELRNLVSKNNVKGN